ncbi:hypothetical protein DFJ58DRAFT_726505 [Suillus subalutaceus]|uniref:uncharacterized protein n=1 Tax=Suillus subalutaceus TaxID=48586 RepID=UPI001B860691|nr:uncharacterized protein DFJ58DRAFT_726505 [Suillus subalutaceus]KAG1858727.1 hypothetical protein DFJ58DRAFT_726505 [Suillus subalutaceus]
MSPAPRPVLRLLLAILLMLTTLLFPPTTRSDRCPTDQIVAENLRRATDNAALQQCRDAGEANIPADELLIPVPPQPSGTALQQWISAFAQLSPNSQNQGTAILTPKAVVRPNISAVSKVLFDSSKEAPSGAGLDSTYNFGIHQKIHTFLILPLNRLIHT